MIKLLSSYISLLQKVFVEIKTKIQCTIKFGRVIGKRAQDHIGKVADTFDEILEYGKIIDFE